MQLVSHNFDYKIIKIKSIWNKRTYVFHSLESEALRLHTSAHIIYREILCFSIKIFVVEEL